MVRQEKPRELPDIGDLAEGLRFAPEQGRIWVQGQRSALLSAKAIGQARSEIVDRLGVAAAREIFSRIGYAEGTDSAAGARTLRPGVSYFEAFAVGPQANALAGFAWAEVESLCADPDAGLFEGKFRVHDSLEANVHVATYGTSSEPVCWLQAGFASGFASAFAGRAILMKEIECRGMGHSSCLLHGLPLEQWDVVGPDPTYYRLLPALNRFDQSELGRDDGIIGISAGFASALHLLRRAAPTDVTLLFSGETGVGKEVLSKLAHRLSRRRDQPFVALNCAAIPEGLVEAELFGVERGGFTGAIQSRPGRFERANGGTLFLDDVATLSLPAQGKVLRAIQEGEIERVGDTRTRSVDVRLMAAANIDLREAVRQGNFREDLYFRLATFPIRVPPLRERRDDIPLFMEHFRRRFAQRHDRRIPGFTARAVEALLSYDFPGNIRELEHRIERAILLASHDEPMDLIHLFSGDEGPTSRMLGVGPHGILRPDASSAFRLHAADLLAALDGRHLDFAAVERELFEGALAEANGNVTAAARRLGLTRRQVALRLEKIKRGART